MNILFIYAGNAQRSPAFELWFKKNRPLYNTKSSGTCYGCSERMTLELLTWADKIYVMDSEQHMFMKRKFPEFLSKTEVIGISDQYARESEDLYRIIEYWTNKEGL